MAAKDRFGFQSEPVYPVSVLDVLTAQQIKQRLSYQASLSRDQIHAYLTDKYALLFRAFRATPSAQFLVKCSGGRQYPGKACLHAWRGLSKESVAHLMTSCVVGFQSADYRRHPVGQTFPQLAL